MIQKSINKKIKILFMLDQLDSFSGGTEQHISFLLSNLPKENIEITFVLLRDAGFFDPEIFPVEPVFLNLSSFSSLNSSFRAVKQLIRLLRERQIDIIQSFFYDSEILAIIASRINGRVLHVAARRNLGHHHNGLTLWRTRLTNQFISVFLANGQSVKNYVSLTEWVPSKKISVILNPLPRKRFEEGTKTILSKEALSLKENQQIVGIVASISIVKDHETFLRAARLIIEQKPETKFLLVGLIFPGRKEKINSLVKKLGLEASVLLTGEHLNPISLMRLFDVGVLSSKSEGLSNTLIEYGAAGIPTVATDVGGNSEIVIHDQTGLIVPKESPEKMSQAILHFLDNPELREKMGKEAKKRISQVFDESKIINQYYAFYNALVEQRA